MPRGQGGGRSFQFGIDSPELGAAFANDIIQAVIPKAIRKQQQQQLLLEAVARNYDKLSVLPPEERKKVYSQLLFPAYGVYQPPLFRKMFGAKPETILPLPEGGIELEAPVKTKSPFGRRGEMKAGITLPPTTPFTFAPSPLLQPEHEAELEKQAALLHPSSPEDQAAWLKSAKTTKMIGIKPSREDILWETIGSAERRIDAFKQANPEATDEQAIASLPSNLRRRYQEHIEGIGTIKAQKEALTEESKGRKIEREERISLLKGREKRLAQQQAWFQDFQENKLKLNELNKKIAAKAKTSNQAYRDALTAYSTYSKNLQSEARTHNQMEMGFSKLDSTYLPARFSEPHLTFEDWLRSEGMPFYERILDLEGKGGVGGEGGTVIPPLKKESKFNSIRGKYLR